MRTKFYVILFVVVALAAWLSISLLAKPGDDGNPLFVAEMSPPKKTAVEKIYICYKRNDGNSTFTEVVDVPLCKGCSSEEKAEAIRAAINEHEELFGRIKAETNALKPSVLQLIGENGNMIKAAGGGNQSKQGKITFQEIGTSSKTPIIETLNAPKWFGVFSLSGDVSGATPDGEAATVALNITGQKHKEFRQRTERYTETKCILDDIEVEALSRGAEVYRADDLTLYIYIFEGKGDGILVGCDDESLELTYLFSTWETRDGRLWE